MFIIENIFNHAEYASKERIGHLHNNNAHSKSFLPGKTAGQIVRLKVVVADNFLDTLPGGIPDVRAVGKHPGDCRFRHTGQSRNVVDIHNILPGIWHRLQSINLSRSTIIDKIR